MCIRDRDRREEEAEVVTEDVYKRQVSVQRLTFVFFSTITFNKVSRFTQVSSWPKNHSRGTAACILMILVHAVIYVLVVKCYILSWYCESVKKIHITVTYQINH